MNDLSCRSQDKFSSVSEVSLSADINCDCTADLVADLVDEAHDWSSSLTFISVKCNHKSLLQSYLL